MSVTISTTEHGTWVECSCGAAEYAPKKLLHRRRCSTPSAQYDAHAAFTAPAIPATEKTDAEIKAFAANVHRTGLTLGRDEDTVEAVRRGFLSVDDAMNTDD